MYNEHPYFPLKNLGKKMCIIHSRTRQLFTAVQQITPKLGCLKQRFIYYLTVSVGQESGRGLVGSIIELLAGPVVDISRPGERRIHFQVHWQVPLLTVVQRQGLLRGRGTWTGVWGPLSEGLYWI